MPGPSEQKPIKNFGEKGAWAYPGTAKSFKVPSIISGIEFGRYIDRVHLNECPLNFFEKMERGRIQGLANF